MSDIVDSEHSVKGLESRRMVISARLNILQDPMGHDLLGCFTWVQDSVSPIPNPAESSAKRIFGHRESWMAFWVLCQESPCLSDNVCLISLPLVLCYISV